MAETRLVADLLRDAAAEHPERDAYVHADKRSTYSWLDRAADGFAATLLDHGVERGDVVVLMLPSSTKFAVCYLGALRVGAITSAINLRLGPVEQASIIARTEPRVTVLGDGASVPRRASEPGHVLPVTALEGRLRCRSAGATAAARPVRPHVHRVDERHDGRAEGRRVRPRAPGRDLAQRRRAHRARATAGWSCSRSRTSAT